MPGRICTGVAPTIFGGAQHAVARLGPARRGDASGTEQKLVATVLLVDDEDALRNVLKRALLRAGFEVHEARDGLIALALAAEIVPDIVVTDLTMPQMNGAALARALAADPALAHIPVLLMTSHAGSTIPMDYPILEKPFPLQLLIDTVQQLLA